MAEVTEQDKGGLEGARRDCSDVSEVERWLGEW